MRFTPTDFPGLLQIEPKVHSDERGCFFESFNAVQFTKATGFSGQFVQDDHSVSRRGVLRGLHYQSRHVQAKIVRVVVGEIFDVVVDLRRSSPTFGKSFSTILSATNFRMLWIPQGFAHGFLTLSSSAETLYRVTDVYDPDHQHCIRWDDVDLGIRWPIEKVAPIVSAKDAAGVTFQSAPKFE